MLPQVCVPRFHTTLCLSKRRAVCLKVLEIVINVRPQTNRFACLLYWFQGDNRIIRLQGLVKVSCIVHCEVAAKGRGVRYARVERLEKWKLAHLKAYWQSLYSMIILHLDSRHLRPSFLRLCLSLV